MQHHPTSNHRQSESPCWLLLNLGGGGAGQARCKRGEGIHGAERLHKGQKGWHMPRSTKLCQHSLHYLLATKHIPPHSQNPAAIHVESEQFPLPGVQTTPANTNDNTPVTPHTYVHAGRVLVRSGKTWWHEQPSPHAAWLKHSTHQGDDTRTLPNTLSLTTQRELHGYLYFACLTNPTLFKHNTNCWPHIPSTRTASHCVMHTNQPLSACAWHDVNPQA
jgi:hypothetical protein